MHRQAIRPQFRQRALAIVLAFLILSAPASRALAGQDKSASDDTANEFVSAQSLIADGFASGRIDYPTSLLYRAYALFGDPRLPAEFAGDGAFGEDNALFAETLYSWPTLPKATQDRLAPTTFCRQDPRDNVQEFSLVLTNHDKSEDDTIRGAFTVAASDGACR
jgi:hypothetical protein